MAGIKLKRKKNIVKGGELRGGHVIRGGKGDSGQIIRAGKVKTGSKKEWRCSY